jgi:hypothetical protein
MLRDSCLYASSCVAPECLACLDSTALCHTQHALHTSDNVITSPIRYPCYQHAFVTPCTCRTVWAALRCTTLPAGATQTASTQCSAHTAAHLSLSGLLHGLMMRTRGWWMCRTWRDSHHCTMQCGRAERRRYRCVFKGKRLQGSSHLVCLPDAKQQCLKALRAAFLAACFVKAAAAMVLSARP